jgi:tetratricopeptide (TPR) repeat protein
VEAAFGGYNRTITVPVAEKKKQRDYLLLLFPVLILIAIGWVVVWSNHFASGFHYDDFPTIVDNQSVHRLESVPRFFANARISSAEKDSAFYRPLLSVWFAFDYWLSGNRAFTYQLENWIWFALAVLMLFLLFRAIPGVNGYAAGFAALVFGVHPVTADTVNYVLQRGTIFSTFCLVSGLVIFIYWPWRLPQRLPLKLKRVPEHGWDEYLRHNFQRLEKIYLKIIHAPSGLYLWPIVPGLLVEPATAVFAPILAVYIVLFEKKRTLKNAIPAGILCAGYWVFQLVVTWKLSEFRRMPAANYLVSQPWVALRYLAKFFGPVKLSVAPDSGGFAHFWDPLALAGFAGVAGLAALAVIAGRTAKWRVVSFGIWWFLIALLPAALTPQQEVEAEWRMFLPFAGLALAIGGLASLALEALPKPSRDQPRQTFPVLSAGVLAAAILAVLGWGVYQRSGVWNSEAALWRNAMQASPHNGRAIMRYGVAQLNAQEGAPALDFLRRADGVTPRDPLIEINLAKALERGSQTGEAEKEYRNAIRDGPSWSRGYAAYGEWLMANTRSAEAQTMAKKALELDPYDNTARRTLMDVFAQDHQWDKLRDFAADTLRRLPGDPDGLRSLEVAQTGIDQLDKAVHTAKYEPTINNYLALSVEYFNTHQYDDCIAAAKEALKINPNQAEAYANMASAYHTLGKLNESLAALREENRLNPNLPNAKTNLAVVEAELARRNAAK